MLSESEKYEIIANIVFNKILSKFTPYIEETIKKSTSRYIYPASEDRIQEISDSISSLQERLSIAWEDVEKFESISMLISLRDCLDEAIERCGNN